MLRMHTHTFIYEKKKNVTNIVYYILHFMGHNISYYTNCSLRTLHYPKVTFSNKQM